MIAKKQSLVYTSCRTADCHPITVKNIQTFIYIYKLKIIITKFWLLTYTETISKNRNQYCR